jgi:hypothetical protein
MSVAVIVGTKKGAAILTSDKSRANWSRDFVLKGWSINASTRDEKGRWYVAIGNDVFGPAIMVSDDLKEWRQLENAPRYQPGEKGNPEHIRIVASGDFMGKYKDSPRLVDQIWTLHASHGAIYAGVSEAGLFVSRDRGESWQSVDGFNNQEGREQWPPGFGGLCAHTILTDGKNPNRIWVGVSSIGFFRTDDGGKTWRLKNDGVNQTIGSSCVHCVTHDPANADVMYRQDHRGMYVSRDGGDNWSVIESGLPVTDLSDGHRCSFGFPIVMDKRTNSVFAVPLNGDNFRFPADGKLTVYRTTNGGEQWEALRNGLPDDAYVSVLRGAMSADELDPCGVYFGTSSGAVYASSDLGGGWAEIATGLPRIGSVRAYVT